MAAASLAGVEGGPFQRSLRRQARERAPGGGGGGGREGPKGRAAQGRPPRPTRQPDALTPPLQAGCRRQCGLPTCCAHHHPSSAQRQGCRHLQASARHLHRHRQAPRPRRCVCGYLMSVQICCDMQLRAAVATLNSCPVAGRATCIAVGEHVLQAGGIPPSIERRRTVWHFLNASLGYLEGSAASSTVHHAQLMHVDV